MKDEILFKAARVDNQEIVIGFVIPGMYPEYDKLYIMPFPIPPTPNYQPFPCYEVNPDSVERLVYVDKEGVQYFTGDKLAIYLEGYSSFAEALAEGDGCVGEINHNGLVGVDVEESYWPMSELSICYKFYHITDDAYQSYQDNN